MAKYVCEQLASRSDIHGEYACAQWVELQPSDTSLVNELAITRAQASELSAVICASLVIGWILGEIGGFIKQMVRR